MMLCRLASCNYHRRKLTKDIAEYDATGMLKAYPVVCVMASYAFNAHLRVYQQKFVGITLFVGKQGCGRPQEADEQMWIPTFFVV